ncbi:DUF3465 domain-containing protein [Colwelliaceae bacterium BS250]
MKPIIIILLLAIAAIAYLNNAPAINGTAEAPIEVRSLDNASSDDILAAAFASPDSNNDSALDVNNDEITIASARVSAKASSTGALPSNSQISHAFKSKKSALQVQGYGSVLKILADDLNGSRHQRFILAISNQHTILVTHNIDLAPKIKTLKQGDVVVFNGEYEWNEKGGVVHWTHYDPDNRREDGWLKHNDVTYQKI